MYGIIEKKIFAELPHITLNIDYSIGETLLLYHWETGRVGQFLSSQYGKILGMSADKINSFLCLYITQYKLHKYENKIFRRHWNRWTWQVQSSVVENCRLYGYVGITLSPMNMTSSGSWFCAALQSCATRLAYALCILLHILLSYLPRVSGGRQ